MPSPPPIPTRRSILRQLAVGLSLAPLAAKAAAPTAADTGAAALPLLSENDPAAKMLRYVEDAHRASGVSAGANCESCSVYSGATGADRGSCTLFPGKLVKAAGWCSAWSSL